MCGRACADTEIGPFITWGVADNFNHQDPKAQACATARWTAIQNDKRFPVVLAELEKRGLALGGCKRGKDGMPSPVCNSVAKDDPEYLAKAMKFLKVETVRESNSGRHLLCHTLTGVLSRRRPSR